MDERAKVILSFNLDNPSERKIYDFLSNYGNGKKAIISLAISKMFLEPSMPVMMAAQNTYIKEEPPIPAKPKREKKQVQEPKQEAVKIEPIVQPVAKEPEPTVTEIQSPVSQPAPAPTTMPPLGGLGGLGGSLNFGIKTETDKDKRLAFLSDADYEIIMKKFYIEEMTEEFLREFERIYKDNEMYPGAIGIKMNRAMQETGASLNIKEHK